jgi:hypothetical protein
MNKLEQFALHWLQSQLSETLPTDVPAEQAFPARLPLHELPGRPSMRTLYAALRRRGVTLPPLFLTRKQIVLIGLLPCCVVIAVALRILSERGAGGVSEVAGVIAAGFFGWAVLAILAKLYLAQLSSADTVGELSQQIFWENAMFFRRLAGIPLSHEQIKRIVIRVLADQTGVGVEEITDDTRLVELTE